MTYERTRMAKDWKDWRGFQMINLTQNDWTFGDGLAATKIFKSAQTTPCELKLIQDSPNTTWLLFLNFVVDVSSNKGAFWLCVVKKKKQTKLSRRPMRRKENTLSSQWEPKVKTSKLPNARENTGNQVVTIFRFESDWLRDWCEFLLDQSQRSKAKPMQSQISFDTYLRIALHFSILNYFRSFSYSPQ